ncbi:MAG: type II toxin-antitoxin system VapC family toxin [Burkholderiales bacterium]|nr:type II toxin-antitoxin system VapC family toxin [Phycisphaerae bacterium]
MPPGQVVLDSSALLAFLCREPGMEVVAPKLRDAMLSTVNYAEVLAKLAELNVPADAVRGILDDLEVRIVDFGTAHATLAASLREITRPLGLSLGDRACLALGIFEQAVVLTADRIWAESDVSIVVKVIR